MISRRLGGTWKIASSAGAHNSSITVNGPGGPFSGRLMVSPDALPSDPAGPSNLISTDDPRLRAAGVGGPRDLADDPGPGPAGHPGHRLEPAAGRPRGDVRHRLGQTGAPAERYHRPVARRRRLRLVRRTGRRRERGLRPVARQRHPRGRAGHRREGHYDLLTTLLHELGHVAGFMPSDPAFESHVQTIGASQVFVAPGIAAPLVDADQELDPNAYPGDLMSATLAPGVRELPSRSTCRCSTSSTACRHRRRRSPSPARWSQPLRSSPRPWSTRPSPRWGVPRRPTEASTSTSPATTVAIPVHLANRHEGHRFKATAKHHATTHGHVATTHRVINPADRKSGRKPARHTPDASLAIELSSARPGHLAHASAKPTASPIIPLTTRETSRPFHRPFKP